MSYDIHDNQTECECCNEWTDDQMIQRAANGSDEKWCILCNKDWSFCEIPAVTLGMTDEEHEAMQRAERRLYDSRSGRYDRRDR